ncbi:MAG TPA: aminofutalosine synthase MqnE [Acidobacteriota bacterium]|nr:aminofutalosine synthase MqnE [Acidobacteriota bacterium]
MEKLTQGILDSLISGAGLGAIAEKIDRGERLSRADGISLFNNPNLLALGALADRVRERTHGRKAFFIRNQHLNYSNICVNSCRFCAFSRKEGQEDAYRMDIDTIRRKITERLDEPVSEIHIVGGLDPDLPWQYYLDMFAAVRELRPDVHIQAFTCVEIAHFADKFGKSVEEVLVELHDAGLGSIPGGGAEVFSGRIRKDLCPTKLGPEGWLEVAKTAHGLGIRSNSTMLYGHMETIAERVDHMIALREAQDETGGFLTFIPLAFHSENTELQGLPPTTGFDDLKTIAVGRLLLDNIPHIKSFWIMVGTKIAQLTLRFGADDIDGTVVEEKITHMAGARTSECLSVEELLALIRGAGCQPVERDTVYNVIREY